MSALASISSALRSFALVAFTEWGSIDSFERLLQSDVDLAQLGSSPQLLATVGIVALMLLGGGLLLRRRLSTGRAPPSDPGPTREEFQTDEERICDLVGENGGRMKQTEIVESVDWSKAKVSRLLADLEEDEQVTKLRLGRENLICLPGYEPTASRSTDSTNTD